MVELYGRSWTRRELLARVGRLEQIGGIRQFACTDGAERGVELIQVRTGAGLSYTVSPTKGLDLSLAEFGGMPFSWQAAGGDVHPQYYEAQGTGWLRTASGGLLMTCGLMHAGWPAEHSGHAHGLHGRVHHTPARQVIAEGKWDGDDYEMKVSGIVDETALFGGHLRMHREITSRLGENTIKLTDTVENAGFEPSTHMMMYHFNFGFPLLTEDAEIVMPPGTVKPREPETPLAGYDRWQAPDPSYRERVYFHRPEAQEGEWVSAYVRQPRFPQADGQHRPLRMTLSWNTAALPQLVQWKMPGAGAHVLGIEPANCGMDGAPPDEAAAGRVVLQPGETVRYELELKISPE
ncbi:aldose 1-epimerase family protein [Paenibacillus sp. GCM10027626]|uniref:aldose 1-epimerase family protein n=1 Tax=Paenibacillus sp. GCM10027626 TaxID=3273411 RepID=UPI003637E7AD